MKNIKDKIEIYLNENVEIESIIKKINKTIDSIEQQERHGYTSHKTERVRINDLLKTLIATSKNTYHPYQNR